MVYCSKLTNLLNNMATSKEHSKVYFDGTGDVQSFVEKVDLIARLKKHEDEEKAVFIGSKLGGPAFDVYRRLTAAEKKDPEVLKTNLLREFCREERNREEALDALMRGSRKSGETPQAYAYRVLKLVSLAYSTLSAANREIIAKDYFLSGLSSELRTGVKSRHGFATMNVTQLCDAAVTLEIAGVSSQTATKVATVDTKEDDLVDRITAGVIEKLQSTNLLGVASGGEDEVAAVRENRGRGGTNVRNRYRGGRRGSSNTQSGKRCRACQSPSHLFRNCPVRHCQACGGKGHDAWSNICPNYS